MKVQGAVLLAESIDDPQDAPGLNTYVGLNLIDFFPLPHVGREKYKTLFDEFIKDNNDLNIVQYTDEQAITSEDGITYQIVPSLIEII